MTESRYPELTSAVPAGWIDLVDDTLDQIFLVDPDYFILLLRPHYGSLLWEGISSYDYGTPQAMTVGRLERAAEAHSAQVCEVCGLPGESLAADPHPVVRCTSHQ